MKGTGFIFSRKGNLIIVFLYIILTSAQADYYVATNHAIAWNDLSGWEMNGEAATHYPGEINMDDTVYIGGNITKTINASIRALGYVTVNDGATLDINSGVLFLNTLINNSAVTFTTGQLYIYEEYSGTGTTYPGTGRITYQIYAKYIKPDNYYSLYINNILDTIFTTGNLTIQNRLDIDESIVYNEHEITINGQMTADYSELCGMGKYQFEGSSYQQIGVNGRPLVFYILELDKPSGYLYIGSEIIVSNSLIMSQGIIRNSQPINLINPDPNSLQYTSGFITGDIVRNIGFGTYHFPTGESIYQGLQLNFTSAQSGEITVNFLESDPGGAGLPINGEGSIIDQHFTEGYWRVLSSCTISSDFNVSVDAAGFSSRDWNLNNQLLFKNTFAGAWINPVPGTPGIQSGSVVLRENIDGSFLHANRYLYIGLGHTICDLVIDQHPQGLNLWCADLHVQFDVVAGGTGPFSYQWYHNDIPLQDGDTISGAHSGTLTINPPGRRHEGNYHCLVSNGCYAYSNSVVLSLENEDPVIEGFLSSVRAEGCLLQDAPAAVNVSELESLGVEITDNCTPESELIVSHIDDSTGICPIQVSRIYTIADLSGNRATCEHIIYIEDTTAPAWLNVSGSLDRIIDRNDETALAEAQELEPFVTDNCNSELPDIAKVSGEFVPDPVCTGAGSYTNTWTSTDNCGNTSEIFTQLITLADNMAPQWLTEKRALDTALECSDERGINAALVLEPVPSADFNPATMEIEIVRGSLVNDARCSQQGSITNSWTLIDDCGNYSETFIQRITITDTTAPVWNTIAGELDRTIECHDEAGLEEALNLEPMIEDNCTSQIKIHKHQGEFENDGLCPSNGTYTNVWTAIDDCGNESSLYTQIVTIIDSQAPEWNTPAGAFDTTFICSDIAGLSAVLTFEPDGSDNCDPGTVIEKINEFNAVDDACNNNGDYFNTWIIRDACGNIGEEFIQTITIERNNLTGILDVPTAFTPNDDGYNDYWIILNAQNIAMPIATAFPELKIEVFDRAGQKRWESEPGYSISPDLGWNGKDHNGYKLPFDSYFYFIHMNDGSGEVLQGLITIIK